MAKIRPTHGMPSDVSMGRQSQFMDILLIRRLVEQHAISDSEAKALYEAWKQSPPGSKVLDANRLGEKYLSSLNRKKYISQNGDKFILTEQGRKVIIEMVTNQPNAFEKDPQPPSYSEIKKKASDVRKKAQRRGRKMSFNLKEARAHDLRITKQG